jgi:hypothetical protein
MTHTLPFVPKYHVQLERGELTGCWTPGFFLAPHFRYFEAEMLAEATRIQEAGGSIVYFDFKADPARDESLRRHIESIQPAAIIDEKIVSQSAVQHVKD